MIAVGDPSSPSRLLSARFDSALVFAAQLHATQARKGSGVPYIAHLLAVASLVLEHGGTEDDAIAALLHDAVEDQGGPATRDRIRALFGKTVTDIVDGCSDTDQTPKPPWKQRKEAYIAHLPHASASVRLVSLADKVHNAQTILQDYRRMGAALWSRFTAGRDDQLWYYRSLVQAFQETDTASQLVADLDKVVSALEHETAAEIPSPPRTGPECGASDVLSRSRRRPGEQVLIEEDVVPAHVMVGGAEIARGSRVRLHPRRRGDILDLALDGKAACVEAIEQDFEGHMYVAVTVEGDPGRDLGEGFCGGRLGHRFFFSLDEIEPLDGEYDEDT
jgi:hypothetical protein